MLAGDWDRERAAAALRDHYVRGRLTPVELSDRLQQVVAARSRFELRRALRDLPVFSDSGRIVRGAARGALLALLTGAYIFFSFVLLFMLAVVLLVHGPSDTVFLGFLVLWLVPTFVLSRLWRRPSPAAGRPRLRSRL